MRGPTMARSAGRSVSAASDREAHDDGAGDADRAQDHELEQHESRQAEQDRQAREEHRAAGRRDRPAHGVPRRGPVRPPMRGSSSRKRLVMSSE